MTPDLPHRSRRTPPADSGQAVVEAAIVLPSMIFLILGILQLTMVQHARIMMEYAAFCAARAGIVYNADPNAMVRAAELALLPTMGRTDTLGAFTRTAVQGIAIETAERTPTRVPLVTVAILRPKRSDLAGVTRHTGGQELDFDDIRPAAAQANILQIQLRYFYHMRIPFANQLLQTLFFAEEGNASAVWHSEGLSSYKPDLEGKVDEAAAQASAFGTGIPAVGPLVAAAHNHLFYFPLTATYSMRMQSNAYLNNLK